MFKHKFFQLLHMGFSSFFVITYTCVDTLFKCYYNDKYRFLINDILNKSINEYYFMKDQLIFHCV